MYSAQIGYRVGMTRKADPAKKPALLEEIIDYLLDKPLSTLTFRGLALALGVSPFTLVYHFGTRDELVHEIIGAIATRQRGFEAPLHPETLTLDSYCDDLRRTFELTLQPRNRALQRLEFEAQMLEAAQSDLSVTRAVHLELQMRGIDALVRLGLSGKEAAIEGRLILDMFYGIQVGLVVNQDDERATEAFESALDRHRDRIVTLRGGAARVG
jgi:AcrR family transcriptional regulator